MFVTEFTKRKVDSTCCLAKKFEHWKTHPYDSFFYKNISYQMTQTSKLACMYM